jgi:hypothetical protein
MKLTYKEKLKKKYSTPVVYKIDPNDPRISHLDKLFDPLKKENKLTIDNLHPKK